MRLTGMFAATALALAALAGCQINSADRIDLNLKGTEKHFIACFDNGTRTAVDNDGKPSWKSGDIICYYSATNGAVRSVTVPADCEHFDFTANVGDEDSFFIAVYGGTGIADNHDGNKFRLSGAASNVQTGNFEDAHVAVAKVYLIPGEQPQSLTFTNVTSLIEFTIERNDVAKVIFRAEDYMQLCGSSGIDVIFNDDVFDFSNLGGVTKDNIMVNIDCPGTYYISTLPINMDTFRMEFYDAMDNLVGVAEGKNPLVLGPNQIVDLGVVDSHIEKVYSDLSASATANCYIVSEAGNYKFKAVKGNSDVPVGDVKGVKVLWESFGTSTAPAVGDIINADVKYADGYIKFSTNGAYKKGNAVIAAYSDAGCTEGNVLWSWHIWCTDKPVDQQYANNAGILMDRDLGATSATPGEVSALGLFYQWGRKDPFPGSSDISTTSKAKSTIEWPSSVSASDVLSGTNSLDYALSHPTTFIRNSSTPYDWYCTDKSNRNDALWTSAKTIYDPCPPGYRVPDGGYGGVYTTAFGAPSLPTSAPSFDSEKIGYDFGSSALYQLGNLPSIWYPVSGYYVYAGSFMSCGSVRFDWTCTASSYFGCSTYMLAKGDIYPNNSTLYRGYGGNVRCLSESSPAIVSPVSVSISDKSISLGVGKTKTLTATVLPDNANAKSVVWQSTDTSVATVDKDGTVTAVAVGKANVYAKSCNNIQSSYCAITVTPAVTDLSASATANCYIVSEAGSYKFKAVKGNTDISAGDVKGVKVLWESVGTGTAPAVGDVIKADVKYADGYITFNTKEIFRKGNAVIAAYSDAGCTEGNVLWSWHIWCTDKPVDQVYNNGAGTFMDRNLGAISATPGNVGALGLMYFWGRKDPFLGSSTLDGSAFAASTISWPAHVDCSTVLSDNTALAYSISHPTTYIYGLSTNYDWYCKNETYRNNMLWAKDKTMYDPCPVGYRVPEGGSTGVWVKALGFSGYFSGGDVYDSTNKGMDFGGSATYKLGSASSIWYPCSGFTDGDGSSVEYCGKYAIYWCCTANSNSANCFYVFYSSKVSDPTRYSRRDGTVAVRCMAQ